jgi:inner membrane protein
VLYNGVIDVKVRFDALNFGDLGIDKSRLMLDKAFLSMGVTDMKGIKQNPTAMLNGVPASFKPGIATNDIYDSGVHLPLNLVSAQPLNIDIQLNLNGSSRLYFLPFGKQTDVNVQSTWADPSFEGGFLPDKRTVTPQGFDANWRVLQFNRNYAQQGTGSYLGSTNIPQTITDYTADYAVQVAEMGASDNAQTSAFGIKFMLPIDEYQKTLRSAKYNAMFIIITFLTFFFIEILNKKRLHPIQYLLIGAAICLFYILLLSISEHLNFNTAYWLAGGIVIILIATYSWFVLQNKGLTALVAGVLLVLYTFFYALLQLQDYALLMGSLGLLLILATIMYLTRHIDWYNLNKDPK